MTIAYIKSNWIRRTLIVVLLPFVPFLFLGTVLWEAFPYLWNELLFQIRHGGDGFWAAVVSCWKGKNVPKSPSPSPVYAEDSEGERVRLPLESD